MLNQMRQGVGSWFVKIFLGLLVLSFAVWGIGDIFTVRPDSSVATIGDTEVSGTQFLNAFNREINRLRATTGETLDVEQARGLGLVDSTLNTLVARALFDQAADDLSLVVADSAVVDDIQRNPAFRDQLGRFDRFQFEEALRQSGFGSEGHYVAAARLDMIRRQLFNGIGGGARAPKVLVEAFFKHDQEKRAIRYLELKNAKARNVPQPDEAAVAAYHEAHKTRFMAPEFRDISYIELRPEDRFAEISLDPAEVEAEYRDRIDEFSVRETRELEQILVDDKETAEKVLARLKAGDDFVKVAKQIADRDPDDLKLGTLAKRELLPPVAEAAFALPLNQPSAPVESDFGWHVLRALKINAGSTKTLAEARPLIEREMKLQIAQDILADLGNRIEDELAGGASLEELARTLDLKHGVLRMLDGAGRNRQGTAFQGLPAAPEFLSVAFENRPGDDLALNESRDGSYFLVRTDKIAPPALKPLGEVRQQVIDAWQNEERGKRAEATAKELLEKLKGGGDLAAEAKARSLELKTTEPRTRSALRRETGLSDTVIESLFAGHANDVFEGSSRSGDGRIVAQVVSVSAAPPIGDGELSRIRELLANALIEDLIGQYQRALQARHGVEVHDGIIDTLFDAVNARQGGYRG